MKIENTTNSSVSSRTVVQIENSLPPINGEKPIITQSYSSSLYKWVTNDVPSYFKNKIFPHYVDNKFQWQWLTFDLVRSTIAYYPKFFKQLLLNSHVPLAQTINIYLLPVKSLLELTGRINPWQSKKILVTIATIAIIIDLAENGYLNRKTHDFASTNNIYTNIDYDFEQLCSAVNFVYSAIDIAQSFGYVNGYVGNMINFSLKFGYQLITIGGAFSLLTNPTLEDNLVPIVANAGAAAVCFGNFIIDEFKTFHQVATCTNNFLANKVNILNNILSKKYAINNTSVIQIEEQDNLESEKEIFNISNQENNLNEDNTEIYYDALSVLDEQNFYWEDETKKQSSIKFKKEDEKTPLLENEKPKKDYGTFKVKNINCIEYDIAFKSSVKDMQIL